MKSFALNHWMSRWGQIRPEERAAVGWSWLYFFCVLSAYYIIRPVRDEMGVAGGVRNLHWLFTATLLTILVVNLLFVALTRRLARTRLISVSYRFFFLNLLLFVGLFHWGDPAQDVWIGRAFFVWTSVFNMFVVSVFWILMVDIFTSEQGQRLFGWIAAGGTLGAVTGSALTVALAGRFNPIFLLLGSAALLEVAVQCVRRLSRIGEKLRLRSEPTQDRPPVGGGVVSGLLRIAKSRYLTAIAIFAVLSTVITTNLYFLQAEIFKSFAEPAARTALFARVDLWVNSLTLAFQVFLTGKVLRWIGVGLSLAAIPAVCVVGLGAVAVEPSVALIIALQVIVRAGTFALEKPAAEVLFTAVEREDKYKAKSFIDTVGFRTGDQIGAWLHASLREAGVGLSGSALAFTPIAALWFGIALTLGFWQKRLGVNPPSVRSVGPAQS